MFKLYFLTSVADVVASVTLNYQLIIQTSLEFENLIFLLKNQNKGANSEKNIKTRFIRGVNIEYVFHKVELFTVFDFSIK
jgi:hypothetical protein